MNMKNEFLNSKKGIEIKKLINCKKEVKKINLGIQLLRMILSFLIVFVHFYRIRNSKKRNFFYPKKYLPYYVPCFFFISFFFSYNVFVSRKPGKIRERLIRILIPYIGWPIIAWLRKNILYYNIKGKNLLKHLYYQLLIGYGFYEYGSFWYLFNLIFISLFFIIIILLFNKYYLYYLFIISFILYIFECSKYYTYFFNRYKRVPVGHSISPIPKMFLHSLTGFFFSSINIFKKYNKCRIHILFLSGTFLFAILYFEILNKSRFYFKRIIINLGIISAFSFFAMLPFDKIKNNNIFSFLKRLTSYTGGIYYLHSIVFHIFKRYIISVRQETFKGGLLIFIISYFICLINSIIFRNSKIYYLFN